MAEMKKKKGKKIPGFMKEMAEERVGEAARKSGGMSRTKLTREMTKDEKAAELTRKMKKGYRKGYRVPKRGSGRTRSSGR